jgi:hypothetical protein
MTGEGRIGEYFEVSGCGLTEVLCRHLLAGIEETRQKAVKVAGGPAEIRTEYV